MNIKRYFVKSPLLKKYIKFIWIIDDSVETEISHLLLPVNNIDIILNFSSPIKYIYGDKKEITTKDFHLNGLRKCATKIIQNGNLNVIGISFLPYGLYRFLGIPISEFTDTTIELREISGELTNGLREGIYYAKNDSDKIEIIERELVKCLKVNDNYDEKIFYIYKKFIKEIDEIKIGEFSKKIGISERQLERLFDKYIGLNPKLFSRIIRFQNASNKIIKYDFKNLTDISQEFYYYDQTHFIKETKFFTGITPTKLSKENITVKSIMQIE